MAGLFITGTDTDVGKTWVTGRLCRCLRNRGMDVGLWKPVQSGFAHGDPSSDSHRLRATGGLDDNEIMICPVSLKAPWAPLVAAHLENKKISCSSLLAASQLLFEKYEILLVEGAGGFLVPIGQDELIADLAQRLGFPVLIVARHGLGTVNHCLLTIEAIRTRGLVPMGIVLNGYPHEPERITTWEELSPGTPLKESSPANPLLIEQFTKVPIIGMIPDTREKDLEKPFEEYINLEKIVENLN
ncbi:dethiobiotin synthase [bacterium F16]|nr:dethiobiotin synthase [bacterium F16]